MMLRRIGRSSVAAVTRAWRQVWFSDTATTPLELSRMGIGAALLIHYGLTTPFIYELWGEAGGVPLSVAMQDYDPWSQSIFFYFTAPWQLMAFHLAFLACCTAFMLGWRTSYVKWIVLIGQISYDHRNPVVAYGVDKILASLLIVLCLAPIGRALSLDRVREVRAAKLKSLAAVPPAYSSPWTGACTRLMQIQMAVLFFYSGVSKLGGDDWRSGDAVWVAFYTGEHYNEFVLDVLASHYWVVNLATYGTILIEIAFAFLIWQRGTRPFLLALAIFLHLQFCWLGLFYFSLVMIMGHMSFVRPSWLSRLGLAWKRWVGEAELVYDGECGFCVRSIAWLLAFDGLQQIRTRDFRTDPLPAATSSGAEAALHLVPPDGRVLAGFDACRYVVLRVPGLWWLVPFFCVPVVSRTVGHLVYGRLAANGGVSSLRALPISTTSREMGG
jgi:predicted DCC family thiol-disulfide oxidoreductase YuxK